MIFCAKCGNELVSTMNHFCSPCQHKIIKTDIIAARDKEWVAGGDKILANAPMITSDDALGYDFYIKQQWQQLKKNMEESR